MNADLWKSAWSGRGRVTAAILAASLAALFAGRRIYSGPSAVATETTSASVIMTNKITRTDDEWRKILTPEQYQILRKKGTERAFTGAYWNEHRPGLYLCAGCRNELFSSKTKFESGTGWPSFAEPSVQVNVEQKRDFGFGMIRAEVHCARCGGHLGHVFDDGPTPAGLRYCINSAALVFEPVEPK